MRQTILSVVLAFVASLAMAQVGGFMASDPKVTITGSLTSKDADRVEGVVTAVIAEGWHINSATPLEEMFIKTELMLEDATLIEAKYPPHEEKSFSFSGDTKLAVYEGTIQIPFTATLQPNVTTIHATLRYQACDDKVCLPPNKATADIDVTKVDAAAAPAPGGNFTPLSAAPKNPQKKSSLLSSDIGATFASRGLPLTLLAIFVLGLALNLTPCVYPLIPITIGFFSQQSQGSRAQRIALSSVYVLGIAITYSALGVFSALSGRLFGAWLQLPAVLVFFALLMLVMASSMFGAFEITVPHFISDRSGGRAGLGGALIMGLLIGIVAAPCVGPFVISLIALVSQLGSPFLGFLMFFVLALGLGVPYLLLGIFSSGLNAIPRSGMWMVQVKKAMGFVLIAMAFHFLRPLTGDVVFRYGVAASLLIGGAYLLFISRTPGARAMRFACALLLLVAGGAFAIPREVGAVVRWDKFNEQAIAAAAAAKKPVIVDFYADWCLPCKEMDDKTFSDPRVASELNRFIRLKADMTFTADPEIQKLVKKYGILGMPTYIFFDSNGQPVESQRYVGFEPPEKFLERLAAVR